MHSQDSTSLQEPISSCETVESAINLIEFMKQRSDDDSRYNSLMGLKRLNTLAKLVQYFTFEHNSTDLDTVLSSPPTFKSLPVKTVFLNDVKYNIFGIYHGANPHSHIIHTLSQKLRKQISSIIRTYHNPSEGIEAYCEEGLSTIFDMDRSREIPDISHIAQKLGTAVIRPEDSPVSFYEILRNLTVDIKRDVKVKRERHECVMTRIEDIGLKALSDMFYQKKFGEIHIMHSLKQPCGLELDYILDLTSGDSERETMSTSKRSFFTAQQLFIKANEKSLKQVNYFGGMHHCTQVSYFLQNPTYEFKKIEKYVEKHKI